MSTFSTKILDYSRETSSFTVPIDPAAVPAASALTALYHAQANMTIGTQDDGILNVKNVNNSGSVATPANEYAQREMKYIVSFASNNTGEQYTRELPCPDLTLMAAGTDLLDLTNATVAAFVTAFEAVASIEEGLTPSAVTVTSIKLVGRNI